MPTSRLLYEYDVMLPQLPAELIGFRVAHLTDLHITSRRWNASRIIAELTCHRVDIVAFTGDYMSGETMPPASLEVMKRLCDKIPTTHGIFGVFGNHDRPDLQEQFQQLPMTWLNNQSQYLEGLPLQILGVLGQETQRPGSLALAQQMGHGSTEKKPLRLLLSHFPDYLPLASDLGVDVQLSGHTHGGQIRFPVLGALINHADIPLKYSSGVLRHGHTLGLVSRGLGEVSLPLRIKCPRQLPLYTFRRGPMLGQPTSVTHGLVAW